MTCDTPCERAAKHPGFVAVAVLNLAIGIGVNTAVFSVVNAVILRRPPYAEPDRLVTVRERFPALGEATLGTAQAEFLDYRDRSQAFSSMAGHEGAVFDLTGGSEPVRIQVEKATAHAVRDARRRADPGTDVHRR